MSESELWVVVFAVFVGIGMVVFWSGYWCGFLATRNRWRDEMIKRGHARFHWENAKWYWVEDLPPPPPDPASRVAKLRELGPKAV